MSGTSSSLSCHPRFPPSPRLLPADGVDGTAMGQRPEEATKGATSWLDALGVLPQRHEDLLGDVLGGLPFGERPHRQPVDEAGVAVVQIDERRLVAPRQALDQDTLRPWHPVPFVHEASPLHNHHSKPGPGTDHQFGELRRQLRRIERHDAAITLRSRVSPSLIRVFTVPRDAERFGDLDVGQTAEEGQLERLSLDVAQLAQRPARSSAVAHGRGGTARNARGRPLGDERS